MGDCDTLLAISNISHIHLKSSGILEQKTLFKSKFLALSHINNRLSEVEFCDVESQINNTNSIYLENAFNEINTISSILIRNNKESSDFPRKHFNIKRKTYKISGKELSLPYEFSGTKNKNKARIEENLESLDKIFEDSQKNISFDKLDKILDYFEIFPLKTPCKLDENPFEFEENINETINSQIIDPQFSEDEQLYEILNNSTEKSFEMPIFSSIIPSPNLENSNELRENSEEIREELRENSKRINENSNEMRENSMNFFEDT